MDNLPRHVGIIMDGNRRYAKERGQHPWKGHEEGAKTLANVLEWCQESNIEELTLYTWSMQNFKRPKAEVEYLMNSFRENFRKLKDDERIKKLRIRVIGRTELFARDIQEMLADIMEQTKDHAGLRVNFAMAYGGREEIVDACRKIATEAAAGRLSPEDITDETIAGHLYMRDEPDLIIRTGGERRTSNFLVWQSNYSEWIFLDTKWPEFSKEDFINCLEEYSQRKRRFGR